MTTKAKVLTGIILSTVLTTGAFAMCDMKNNKQNMMKQNHQGMNYKNMKSHHKGKMPIMSVMKQLNLSADQRVKIREIMIDSRKQKQTLNDAFTKSTFDKQMFIKMMSEKRENMIKSKAEMIEKVYAVLDVKQKEQFKTLIELKSQKMNNKRMSFGKNCNGRG